MFAWDLFREFRDSLKIAKFNTREFEKKINLFLFLFKYIFVRVTKNRIYMYTHHFNTSAVHIWLYYALHNNHDIF